MECSIRERFRHLGREEEGIPLQDFLATRLLHGGRLVLKRGLEKAYAYETAEVSGIKGKLDLASTLKGNLLHKHRTVCSYDELSQDTLANQLLYTTLSNLVRAENIDQAIRGSAMVEHLHHVRGSIEAIFIVQTVIEPLS